MLLYGNIWLLFIVKTKSILYKNLHLYANVKYKLNQRKLCYNNYCGFYFKINNKKSNCLLTCDSSTWNGDYFSVIT